MLAIVGPTYFPDTVRTIIMCYFGYALPRFIVILTSGLFACIKCISRNNTTDSTIWIHKASGSEIPFTEVTHVVIICIYTEPIEKIAETLDTLSVQMEVSKQMMICMVRLPCVSVSVSLSLSLSLSLSVSLSLSLSLSL
eukprot:SAG31_NODE_13684_length_853_cov_1.395225_1_plen_138_part_10